VALQKASRLTNSGWEETVPELQDAQCGYCRKGVAMERIGPVVEYRRGQGYSMTSIDVGVHTTYLCPRESCLRPSIAFFEIHDEMGSAYITDGPFFIPRGQPEPMDGLPDEIQEDRREAWSCLYGGDYRAAVIMGRAAIQRAVRTMQARGGGLKAEINDLHQRQVITKFLKDWADETRIAGDDAAHPEDLGAIDREEAEESLKFTDAFLEHGIALPAARDARKAARSGGSTA
jgi:hypothetical protein